LPSIDKWHFLLGVFLLITIDHEICHGKPKIRGLRYPVENILES
jgi:uncharacterized protein (DUF433 family)